VSENRFNMDTGVKRQTERGKAQSLSQQLKESGELLLSGGRKGTQFCGYSESHTVISDPVRPGYPKSGLSKKRDAAGGAQPLKSKASLSATRGMLSKPPSSKSMTESKSATERGVGRGLT